MKLRMNPLLKQQEIRRVQARVRRLSEAVIQNSSPSLASRLKGSEMQLAAWKADYDQEQVKPPKRTRRTKGASIPKDAA